MTGICKGICVGASRPLRPTAQACRVTTRRKSWAHMCAPSSGTHEARFRPESCRAALHADGASSVQDKQLRGDTQKRRVRLTSRWHRSDSDEPPRELPYSRVPDPLPRTPIPHSLQQAYGLSQSIATRVVEGLGQLEVSPCSAGRHGAQNLRAVRGPEKARPPPPSPGSSLHNRSP